MKNAKSDQCLFSEFSKLLDTRNDCLRLERSLFQAVVAARLRKVDPAFRKSLQGVLICLRTSITLMNSELYSGRFSNMKPSAQFSSDSEELPF